MLKQKPRKLHYCLIEQRIIQLFVQLLIQKSDKGNSVIIVDRQDYKKKMDNILSDQKKLIKVNLEYEILLNFAVNQEKRNDTQRSPKTC